jgi:hypothetical protein
LTDARAEERYNTRRSEPFENKIGELENTGTHN